jgi:transposase, IS5 family
MRLILVGPPPTGWSTAMRTFFPPNYQQQSTPIEGVSFQLHCRHELIPILAALQHIYRRPDVCQQLLQLIQGDVNKTTQATRGRTGLSYWEILVLAAVRLGCNCDYDALQDLAENHRTLRQILGVADQPSDPHQPSPYPWQRLRDNLCLLQPETIEKINHLLVSLGHELEPTAAEHVRGDAFVAETNIHYPTEANLLGDGLRKILDVAEDVQERLSVAGWRQQGLWRQRLKKVLRYVNRACRSKGQKRPELVRRSYQALYDLTEQLLDKGRQLEQALAAHLSPADAVMQPALHTLHEQLQQFLGLTTRVLSYSRRRVLRGEKIANDEKVFSFFEPHTELVNRGKQPQPIQFGHKVLVIEDGAGFICHYRLLDKDESEPDIVVGELTELKKRVPGMQSASFDSGFHSPANQEQLLEIVPVVCIPVRGSKQAKAQAAQASAAFAAARRAHPGVEALIGVLQRGNGLKRCRDRSLLGYQRYVGIAILGHNLHTLGKLVLRQQNPHCAAARSKRQQRSAAA